MYAFCVFESFCTLQCSLNKCHIIGIKRALIFRHIVSFSPQISLYLSTLYLFSLSLSLTQMSRVRRMCRLLVDCDDNTASKRFVQEDPDDYEIEIIGGDGEDGDNLLTPGSGTMSMAKCWRDLVQVEVTQVTFNFSKRVHVPVCTFLTMQTYARVHTNTHTYTGSKEV